MKIGIILHPYGEKQPGGLARTIYEWAQSLVNVDRENDYIIYFKNKPKFFPDFIDGKRCRAVVVGGGIFWHEMLRFKERSDIYLFQTPILPVTFSPRSIIIIQDFPYLHLKTPSLLKKVFFKLIYCYHRYSINKADALIAVSENTKEELVGLFGVSPKKITRIYMGFKKISEVKEESVVLPNSFLFYAGVIKERKNVRRAIEAFTVFLKNHKESDLNFVLAGRAEGRYFEEIKKFIDSEKINGKIHFIGHLTDGQLSYSYRRARAFVFPSIVESFGFPILEAMSCGVPVITSNIFGPAELGANGSAVLINPYEPKEMAEAMEKIVFSDVFRRELIEKSREQLKLFSWENTGRETLVLLEKIAKPKSPKICFVTHNVSFYNGGGVLARNIISRLKIALSASAQVLTAENSGFPDELPLLSRHWFLSPFKIFSILKAIRSADFIHAFDVFPYGFIAALFSLGSNARLIITVAGTGAIRYLYLPLIYPLAKFAYCRADKIIAISQFTKDEILKRISGLAISVINPGIDLSVFGKISDEKFLAKTKKFQPYILSVGSIRFRKGYRRSIQAFKKVSEIFPDLHYVIIGKKYTDKEYNRLKKLIDELDLKEKVFFVEDIETDEELAAFYHGAKLFGLMSLNVGHDVEGFGIVFTEAAAAGLPVVGSKDCGVEDSVKDGANGFLVAENDVEGFADAVIKILKDEKLYAKMSVCSKNFANQFSWEKKIAKYIKLCYIA